LNETLASTDRIAVLEADNARLRAECDRLQSLLSILMDNNPDGIAIADAAAALTFNASAEALLGVGASKNGTADWSEKYGLRTADDKPYPVPELPLVRALHGETVRDVSIRCLTPDRPEGIWLSVSARPIVGGGAVAVFRDLTDRRNLELDLAARNAELASRDAEKTQLVERLRVAVNELSTPVLEVWDDVLALPVVGVVDTQRSAQMVEKLLAEVVDRRCKHVIVDLTGVDVVDTSTADRFIKMARAVELLGATCVITGIQPAVAQTLVELGVTFTGLSTQRNLKRALEWCMARLRREAARGSDAVGPHRSVDGARRSVDKR
jgi:rsbT co-antagonist protein RsbR